MAGLCVSLASQAFSLSAATLSAYDKNAPVGWATVGGTVTGSNNKTVWS